MSQTNALTTLTLCFNLSGPASRYMHTLCDRFEREQGVLLARHAMDIHALTERLCGTEPLPELALIPSDMLALAKRLRLSPIPRQWELPPLTPLSEATLQLGGRQLGIPILAGNHLLQFYDKSQGRARHEWLQADEPGVSACCGIDFEEPYWLIPFLIRFAGWPIGHNRVQLDSPAMTRALLCRQRLQRQGRVRHYDCRQELNAALISGDVPAIITGEWEYATLREAMGERLGIAPLPTYGNLPCRSFFSSVGLLFPGQSLQGPHAPLLQAFAQLLLSQSVQQGWMEQAARQPVRQDLQQLVAHESQHIINSCINQCCISPTHPLMHSAWQAMTAGLKDSHLPPHSPPGRLSQQMQRLVGNLEEAYVY
ncbi:MAG: hypothetical protein ACRCRW_14475 [Aeromonadaceae bacterium]